MITLLSGGTGTPKLIQGFLKILPQEELSIIVNTAEDRWLSHGYFSPDVDTVVYTLSGIVDDSTWHGIINDTYHTHETLKKLGSTEYLKIGDLDRALHIWRGERMKNGETLSMVTKSHCKTQGVKASVIPMSDDMVETVIDTKSGDMGLHEFWVKNKGKPEVMGVRFKGIGTARANKEAVKAIVDAERVVIGPSNPVTSIYPIIALAEVRNALIGNREKVICVSPIIGDSAFSGPAEKLMKVFGIKVSAHGILDFYRNLCSHLIIDSREKIESKKHVRIHKTNILMDTIGKRKSLAEFILGIEL